MKTYIIDGGVWGGVRVRIIEVLDDDRVHTEVAVTTHAGWPKGTRFDTHRSNIYRSVRPHGMTRQTFYDSVSMEELKENSCGN